MPANRLYCDSALKILYIENGMEETASYITKKKNYI